MVVMAVRPGMVDTGMQTSLREVHRGKMLEGEVGKFVGAFEEGRLGDVGVVGGVMARVAVGGGEGLSGKCFAWDGEEARPFRE